MNLRTSSNTAVWSSWSPILLGVAWFRALFQNSACSLNHWIYDWRSSTHVLSITHKQLWAPCFVFADWSHAVNVVALIVVRCMPLMNECAATPWHIRLSTWCGFQLGQIKNNITTTINSMRAYTRARIPHRPSAFPNMHCQWTCTCMLHQAQAMVTQIDMLRADLHCCVFSTLELPCGRVRLDICLQHRAVALQMQCPPKYTGPVAVLNMDRHRSTKTKYMHRDWHLNNCDPFPEDESFTTPCHQFHLPPASLLRSVRWMLLPTSVCAIASGGCSDALSAGCGGRFPLQALVLLGCSSIALRSWASHIPCRFGSHMPLLFKTAILSKSMGLNCAAFLNRRAFLRFSFRASARALAMHLAVCLKLCCAAAMASSRSMRGRALHFPAAFGMAFACDLAAGMASGGPAPVPPAFEQPAAMSCMSSRFAMTRFRGKFDFEWNSIVQHARAKRTPKPTRPTHPTNIATSVEKGSIQCDHSCPRTQIVSAGIWTSWHSKQMLCKHHKTQLENTHSTSKISKDTHRHTSRNKATN